MQTKETRPGKADMAQKIEYWQRNRRKWYHLYFFLGVGINFLLYFTKPFGFDPSGSVLWGSFYGLGIPLAAMFAGIYIHEKIMGI